MRIWVLNPPFLPKFSRSQRSPAVTKSGTLYFPLWLSYAVGVLEQSGHDVTFTDAPARGLGDDAVDALAAELQPQLVVMETSTPSVVNDGRVAQRIRAAVPGAFLVFVGTHASALPGETLSDCPAVDAVARGEYEYTLRDLAASLEGTPSGAVPAALRAVGGLSFREDGAVTHNPDRPLIADLDRLPWVTRVYRKHLRIEDYFNANALHPMVTLLTGRGCPFRCTFCVYPQVMMGRRYRFRSVGDVAEEMAFVQREFPGVRSVWIEDDTLTAAKRRCLALADALRARGVRIPWQANARVDLDRPTLLALRAAGCRELCVGFESGDQSALDAMHKGTRVEDMVRFAEDARASGILLHGCFMFGLPGETEASIRRTIDLSLRLPLDTVQFYPLMVYPGTEAYDDYRARGWITAPDYRGWLTAEGLHNCVVRNESLSSQDLVRLCDEGRRRFYLRPRYLAYKFGRFLRDPAERARTLRASRVFLRYLLRGSRAG